MWWTLSQRHHSFPEIPLILNENIYLFLLFFKYSCLHFPTTTFHSPPTTTSHPQCSPPLALSRGPLHMFFDDPTLYFPGYAPSSSPLVTVSLFFISVFLVLFYLLICFVYQVPHVGEIIENLSYFIAWLISLSIILSISIHAVVQSLPFIIYKNKAQRNYFFVCVAKALYLGGKWSLWSTLLINLH